MKADTIRRSAPAWLLVGLLAIGTWFGVAWSPTVAQPAADDEPDITYNENAGGGATNNVTVVNRVDDRLRVRGSIQLNRIPSDMTTPINQAVAYATCTDCQTFSVALQINLISTSATFVVPQNAAAALNFYCTRCVTVARALQFVVQVEDPLVTPPGVADLIQALERELRVIASEARSGRMTVADAETRINAVIERFRAVGISLYEDRDEETEATTPLGP